MNSNILNQNVTTQVTYELKLGKRMAEVLVVDDKFDRVNVRGVSPVWNYEDWEFLGLIADFLQKKKKSGEVEFGEEDFDGYSQRSLCDV